MRVNMYVIYLLYFYLSNAYIFFDNPDHETGHAPPPSFRAVRTGGALICVMDGELPLQGICFA